jgi:flagellar hook-length control protein FliK
MSPPVVSASLNETTALRSPNEAGAPEKPFNAVLQQELTLQQNASAKMPSPAPGNPAPVNRSHAAAPKPAEPAIPKAVRGHAADDVQAIEAGIVTLSAELAAMVTNMLQMHAGATPAKVESELPPTDDGDSMPGNIALADNAAQLACLALALQDVNSDASTPTDRTDPGSPGTDAKVNRSGKVDLAGARLDAHTDSIASLMQARAPAPEASLSLQAGRAELSTDFSADLSADPAPLPGLATVLQAAGTAVNPAMPPAAPAASATLSAPLGSTAWNQALAQRVTWMVSGTEQSATLTLNPPELGPLHIVLNLSHAHADASFIASQPEVRQALEAAMPKLRDMLSEAGIALGQASVSSGAPDANGQFRQGAPRGPRAPRAVAAHARPPEPAGIAGRGLIDTFA